jgi:hypothetical protein
LGGDRKPKRFPENEKYDKLTLEFLHEGTMYSVSKAFAGGAARIVRTEPAGETSEVAEDVGELLVRLAGAGDKQIIRSKSRKGPLTGADLRHWFLISQPNVISDDPTTGPASAPDRFQRAASFYVFLTGMDDAAVTLAKTKAEKDSIGGQIFAAESAIQRANAGLPPDLTKAAAVSALEKVDETLNEITRQYEARARQLRLLRQEINTTVTALRTVTTERTQSQAMVHRFDMLDQKYVSDLERLDAANEGIAYFQTLKTVSCPLCNTPVEQQISPADLRPSAPANYRVAVQAEAEKIRALREGLRQSRTYESKRFDQSSIEERRLRIALADLEARERQALSGLKVEFSADPKELAVRRGELSSQIDLFEEIERLNNEIERLRKLRSTKASPIVREAIGPARAVADISRDLLRTWGFQEVNDVALDTESCDLVVNGRARLNFGAGKRGLMLAALTIAVLENALHNGYPHAGFVVIDSPLKAYADPKNREGDDVPLATVRDNFYEWLSKWSGPGQIVILENEQLTNAEVGGALQPTQFSGESGEGRAGFYMGTQPVSP